MVSNFWVRKEHTNFEVLVYILIIAVVFETGAWYLIPVGLLCLIYFYRRFPRR